MQKMSTLSECKAELKRLEDIHLTFIRNVERELRIPLTILESNVEMLCNGDLGRLTLEQQHALSIIADRTLELRNFVNRTGTLLSVQAGISTRVPLDLAQIVQGVVEARRPQAQQSGLTLEVEATPQLPTVMGDPHQLRQAFDCLIENALKFTPYSGRVTVQVDTEATWARITVVDTGLGIEMQELTRLFERPFHQLDGSSRRRYGGIGLGLTLAQAVVEAHDGQIEMQSRTGYGTRVTVELPAQGSPDLGQSRTRRILIVDDDEFVGATLKRGLNKLPDCESVAVTKPEQALTLFDQQPFDLLITDYKMPGMDGLTLAGRVHQQYPQTIIIFITAYGDNVPREQVSAASIRCILDKPVELTEIRSVVLEALNTNLGALDTLEVAQ
jgi:CheY-like chemotaxis protein